MEELHFEVQIFSPRWGHEDTYNVIFKRDIMSVGINGKVAKCTYVEGQDPQWIGHERIDRIFTNDSITGPAKLENLLEYLWTEWRNGSLNDEKTIQEFNALIEWINIITKNKPKTDFWRQYF